MNIDLLIKVLEQNIFHAGSFALHAGIRSLKWIQNKLPLFYHKYTGLAFIIAGAAGKKIDSGLEDLKNNLKGTNEQQADCPENSEALRKFIFGKPLKENPVPANCKETKP